jgi:hypothetical protein
LSRKAYYFVPLTLNLDEETMIADRYDVQLADSAICHRNHALGDSQSVFVSTRLMEDSFAIASARILARGLRRFYSLRRDRSAGSVLPALPHRSRREVYVYALPAAFPFGIRKETIQHFGIQIALAFEVRIEAALG